MICGIVAVIYTGIIAGVIGEMLSGVNVAIYAGIFAGIVTGIIAGVIVWNYWCNIISRDIVVIYVPESTWEIGDRAPS